MKLPLGKIVVAGGAGLLGRVLTCWMVARGHEVVVLSRGSGGGEGVAARVVHWDGKTVGAWCAELEGAGAVINLAGRSVDCRYTRRHRREILDSRIDSTRVLGEAIRRCAAPPAVWLNSSTATIYKHSVDRAMDEATGVIGATAEAKDAFSIEVARAWEAAFDAAAVPGVRKVALRTAVVLAARRHGAYRILRRLVRAGLGGKIGSGTQYVSWIHEDDFCRAVDFILAREDLAGAINVASPNPVPNAEFMRQFRRACHRGFGIGVPRGLLEVATFFMRTESELVIKSRRVVPGRLLDAGFRFLYPEVGGALAALESAVNPGPHPAGSHRVGRATAN